VQKYKKVAEQKPFKSNLYFSPFTSQIFAPEIIINEAKIIAADFIRPIGRVSFGKKAQ
jgi:hypothetical protein